jgi:hypothetical protein
MHCQSLLTLYTYVRFRLGLIDLVEYTVAKIAIQYRRVVQVHDGGE